MANILRWEIAQKAELKWWKQYLNKKPRAFYLNWKREYWSALLNKIQGSVSIEDTDTILDVGCGPAGTFIALERNDVTAIDPLLNQYQANLEHFDATDYPNVKFINSSIEDYSSQAHFDLVICMNAINHVRDIETGFKRLSGHINTKGKLIVSIDAHNFPLLKRLFRLIPLDILHPHQYDVKEYKKMITKNGLQLTACFLLKRRPIFNYYIMVAEKSM